MSVDGDLCPAKDAPHILTVNVEEYFHGGALERTLSRKHWERLDSRIEANLEEVLEFFAEHRVTATFFVLGWSAERNPEIVHRIVDAGHEVASRGYWPRGLRGMVPEQFREELGRTRLVLESCGAPPVRGFRSPRWLRQSDLWALDVLAEEGYAYDSSVNPAVGRFSRDRRFFTVHRRRHSASDLPIWEVPISTSRILGVRVAISGGNYIRQLPHWLLSRAVRRWHARTHAPLVFYFQPWELDQEQPQITAASTLSRIRQYRNLAKTRTVLEEYFPRFRFQAVREFLGLAQEGDRALARNAAPPALERTEPRSGGRAAVLATRHDPVTVVIPLYNEQATLSYSRRTLEGLRQRLGVDYPLRFVLVDDASTDDTWRLMGELFTDFPHCKLLRHERNRGVAAAILTGIRTADTEIVCSIDCDCSYDPSDLAEMLPLIDDADLVTASPYHPEGRVFNVPRWRLFLSRNLSRLYSRLLGQRLYTCTSCFRVYRRSKVADLELHHGGFLGIAELLIKVKQAGGHVVEYPTTLESRLLGVSKMKTLRTIGGHLGLLWELSTRKNGQRRS